MRKTKLKDFGGLEFAEGYRRIANTKSHRSQILSNLGHISAKMELNLTMVRRLRLVDYFKKNPEVLKTPVRSPVFLLGYSTFQLTFILFIYYLKSFRKSSSHWNYVPAPSPVAGSRCKSPFIMGTAGLVSPAGRARFRCQ